MNVYLVLEINGRSHRNLDFLLIQLHFRRAAVRLAFEALGWMWRNTLCLVLCLRFFDAWSSWNYDRRMRRCETTSGVDRGALNW